MEYGESIYQGKSQIIMAHGRVIFNTDDVALAREALAREAMRTWKQGVYANDPSLTWFSNGRVVLSQDALWDDAPARFWERMCMIVRGAK